MQEDLSKYCSLMEELKLRVQVLDAFSSGTANALYNVPTVESTYLQFRKILELIALGSLIAHKDEFSKVYGDFSKCWNAQYLFRDIERINPNFYPEPILEVPHDHPTAKIRWELKKEGFLTKQDFLKLYEKCGAIMHACNPYRPPTDYESYAQKIPTWHEKIIGLLNTHTIKLVNNPHTYLIHMNENNRVRGYVFTLTASNRT